MPCPARGGVWIDATIVALRPVTDWVDLTDDAELQCFRTGPRSDESGPCPMTADHPDVLENWALALGLSPPEGPPACPPQSPLVCAWFREFDGAVRMGLWPGLRGAAALGPPVP